MQPHGDQRFTILRVEGPDNRGETTWSTRDYGRFGATRTVDVTAAQPLVLDTYYVIADGERDAAWCAKQAKKLKKKEEREKLLNQYEKEKKETAELRRQLEEERQKLKDS